MNPLDDLFRDGLGARKADVPDDLWQKIQARKPTLPPEGESLDHFFADKLKERTAPVPAGMWQRIVAGRTQRPLRWRYMLAAAASLLLLVVAYQSLVPTFNDDYPVVAATNDDPANDGTTNLPELGSVSGTEAGFKPGASAGLAARAEVATAANGQASASAPAPAILPQPKKAPANRSTVGTVGEIALVSPAGRNEDVVSTVMAESASRPGNDLASSELPSAAETAREEVTSTESPNIYRVSPLANLAIRQLPDQQPMVELKRQYHRPKPRKGGSFKAAPRHRSQTELLFGLAYANQQFSVNTAEALALRAAREVSEFPEASYQVTLRQSYRLGERLSFIGGLTYAQIRNQFEFERVINGREQLRKVNNTIRLLEAPLLLGYSLPGKKRLKVSLNAGPVVNLTTGTNGRFLHPDAREPLSLAADGNYRKNIGLGVMTSLTTTYLVGKTDPFLLVVEPFFKSYLGSFTAPDAPLREKYWMGGMQLGVRKAF